MTKPNIPTIAPELWRAVLDRLIAFREAEPWKSMPDSAVTAYVDSAGQPWFACVLGNAREVFGICLYRGATGLRFHRIVQELGEFLDPTDHLHEQDAITVWYGPKSDLTPEVRKMYQDLGFAPKRGSRLAWPDIRSHRPGYFPWHPEESELRVLLNVIPGILRFAELYRHQPDCFEEHGEWDLPTVPTAGSPVRLEDLEWRTWLTPVPPEIGLPVPVDAGSPEFQRVSALPQAEEGIEVDWFHMPEAVVENGRPFYPRCVATFRAYGGYCFGMKLINPEDDAARVAAAMILEAIEVLGARPTEIRATKDELAIRLRPLATSLGAETKTVQHLDSVEEFRSGLEEHMRGPDSR